MMKKIVILLVCTIFSFSVFPTQGNTSESTLRDDYKRLEGKRKRIEKERKTYETELRRLSSKRYGLSLAVNKCVAQNNEVGWDSYLEEAKTKKEKSERQRLDLVELRKKLDLARSEFESIRSSIEKKYRGGRRGEPYEIEFRKYMEDLDTQYLDRVDPELFAGYESYLAGVGGYIVFLERFRNECSKEVIANGKSRIQTRKSPVTGKMEVTIKIASIPLDVRTAEDGMKEFSVDADGQLVKVAVKPETWEKLEKAEERSSEWTAILTGRVGQRFKGGFFLKDSDIRILKDSM